MADDCRCNGAAGVFLGFIMGAAIGGGIALLTAPRSGKETRERIRESAEEFEEKVKETAAETEQRLRKTVADTKELLQRKQDQLRHALEAGKEAMAAEREKPQEPA
jgi:gas vesicle protein